MTTVTADTIVFANAIDADLTAADQAAINHTNARELFPRLTGLHHGAHRDGPIAVMP
jgi:hypothetical protein